MTWNSLLLLLDWPFSAFDPWVPGKNPPSRAPTSLVSQSVHPVQSGAADLCPSTSLRASSRLWPILSDHGTSEVVHQDEKRLTHRLGGPGLQDGTATSRPGDLASRQD